MKNAESIEMPFGLMTRAGPSYHELDWVPDTIVKYWDTLRCAMQKRLNRSTCRFGQRLLWAHGTMY